MRLLLDTHAFIWWDSEPSKLSADVLRLCRDPDNTLLLSFVSVWEMQIKSQLGKLTLREPLNLLLKQQQTHNQIVWLPIKLEHILNLSQLPHYHRDPFDRLLIAQSQFENLTLVTNDRLIREYDVPIIG